MNDGDSDHRTDHIDRGLAFDLQMLMSRRRAVLTMGGLGLGALGLIACSSDDDSSSAATDTQPTGSSTVPPSTDGETLECVDEIPDETQGPFPGDGSNGLNVLTEDGIVREDIRASFGTSTTVADGIPLEVVLTIRDAAGCAPISGAAVYVWQCDAAGNY